MNAVVPLGRLERADIRSAWPREDVNFTQWLAREENASLLSDSINVSFVVTHTEKDVGPYRADIVGEAGDGAVIVIENQYGRTDHDHLGKVLTYAADLDARYVVWIAEEFTEQHQSAVDWLNDRSGDDLSVFAVQIELWKIAASDPAPRFHVVSQPNDWTRQVRAAVRSANSEYADKYERYWFGLLERAEGRSSLPSPQKGSRTPYQRFQSNVPNCWYAACATLRDAAIWVEAVFQGAAAVEHFGALQRQAGGTDTNDPKGIVFDFVETRKSQKIKIATEGDPNDENDWSRQHEQLLTALAQLRALVEEGH